MRTKTNPVFYADELRLHLSSDPERAERILAGSDDVHLLTWNVFSSLDTHPDRDYLAYRLQALGGPQLRAPLRLSLWTGRDREPLLTPSGAYRARVRERARAAGGDQHATRELEAPIEVPVRLESPDVVALVETVGDHYRQGTGGRDRLVELIDAGLEQARRLSKALAVAVIHPAGTPLGRDVAARVERLHDPATLAAEMSYRTEIPPLVVNAVTWPELLRIWESERPYLRLGGQPVRAFTEQVQARGLT
jgi:hypothetical protein